MAATVTGMLPARLHCVHSTVAAMRMTGDRSCMSESVTLSGVSMSAPIGVLVSGPRPDC